MSSGWYERGFSGLDKLPNAKIQNRFWIKPGEERKIIILDSEPITFWEHQVTMNGEWRYFFTCRKNINEKCPLCDEKLKKHFIGIFTTIDLVEFTTKQGEKIKNPLRILGMKQKALPLIKRHAEKGRLKNGMFAVSRTDSKAFTSGNIFDFEGEVDPLTYNPAAKIYDYEDMFRPLSEAELREIAKLAEPDDFGSRAVRETATVEDSSDVPF